MDSLVKSLREKIAKERNIAFEEFRKNGKPSFLLSRLCEIVDDVLIRIWDKLEIPPQHALVAVGGYGRGELYPYSDVDILFLLDKNADEKLRYSFEKLLPMLWDLGLEIGHSIRTVDECIEASGKDITIQTALLEARLITGNKSLFLRLKKRYREQMQARSFFQAKLAELRQRHIKFEDTPYSLEPNCKESPGGLRDLQVILWIARAARIANSWRGLVRLKLITPTEAKELTLCENLFKTFRIYIHLEAKRREDKILFDLQIPLAKTLGFSAKGESKNLQRASEEMMQSYYRAAKTASQLNMILLQNIETFLFEKNAAALPIDDCFQEINSRIDIIDEELFDKNSSCILKIFLALGQRRSLTGISARTLRKLWHARIKIDDAFRENPANREIFIKIFQSEGVTRALIMMNQTSILGQYLPVFRKIVGQMQHDLFHTFTVDQHTLNVLQNIYHFTLPEYAHEFPQCARIIAGFNKPWLLYIAALFHDIAKGRRGDHEILGMEDARNFCMTHKLSDEDTELVVFLVRNHLILSRTAQKKDLSDPDTIRSFAQTVASERHLKALFLLTVADICATSPQAWNAWKGKLLEDLYRLTLRVLGGEIISEENELQRKQNEAVKNLRLHELTEDAHKKLWSELDITYFLRHDANEIVWHTRNLFDKTNAENPIVKCRLAPIGEGLQVMVYSKDKPELFARICGYFAKKNYSILDAKIHTTRHSYALDTFLVISPLFAKNYRHIINLVEHDLSVLLSQENSPITYSKTKLSRQSRSFPLTPTVDLRPDGRNKHHILTITANDRNGLLYAIATVLAKYNISLHTAKIMTMGERVEDVFLIEGETLRHDQIKVQLETDLLEILRA